MAKNKRNNASKKRRLNRSSGGNGGVQPFATALLLPPSRRFRLAYAEKITLLEASANVGSSYFFSLNSLFDPNSSGVGVQPVGFDQLSAMYGQFRVWNVRVKLSFDNPFTTSSAMYSTFATFQPVVPANPSAWLCQPFGTSKSVSPLGGGSSCVLQRKFSIPAVLGLTKGQYQSDMDFVGTPSGNPTRQAYLMVGAQSMTAGAVGGGNVYVQIEYEAEFSQPQALNMS